MAEITLTLLTPISVRLSWTGGSGDYEVWWKSDHPAGQEFIPLATVTGTSYDVGNLSWTTTYYFKVRPVGGAFGSEIHVFICCGQAVLFPGYGPPTFLATEYWQQSSAPGDDGSVVFVGKNLAETSIFVWLYDGAAWRFGKQIEYVGNYFPTGVVRRGEKNAILDSFHGDSGWFVAWVFTFYNEVYSNTTWPIPQSQYSILNKTPDEEPSAIYYLFPDGYRFVNYSDKSIPNSIVFNESFRIVLGLYNEEWPADIDDIGFDLGVMRIYMSKDYGSSWTMERIYTAQSALHYNHHDMSSSIAEDGIGNVFCVMEDVEVPEKMIWGTGLTELGNILWDWPGWDEDVDPIVYVVLKWVEGAGATEVHRCASVLVDVYSPPPDLDLLEPGYNAKQCNIAAEGSKIAVAYLYSYSVDSPISYRYYGDAVYKLDISTNGGSSWSTKTITGSWKVNPEWIKSLPGIVISNGNILVYLIGGTYAAPTYRIMRSTDDGDTWSEVYDFAGMTFDFPWVVQMEARGAHITLTGCKFGVTVGGSLAFFQSLDAGATWGPVEVIPTDEEFVVVPA